MLEIKKDNILKNGVSLFSPAMPIGTMLSWHKTLVGFAVLGEEWWECNGQIVVDPSSPLNGKQLPDLNHARRFLRGGTESGIEEEDSFKKHKHTGTTGGQSVNHIHTYTGSWKDHCTGYGPVSKLMQYVSGTTPSTSTNTKGHTHTYNTSEIGDNLETKPKNMSVVWIIKVR